jgi:hypothetical protein
VNQETIADRLAGQLAPFLGPFNAKVAVKTYAKKALDLPPEALAAEHVVPMLDALRPMLNTLVGQSSTGVLLERIRQEVQ